MNPLYKWLCDLTKKKVGKNNSYFSPLNQAQIKRLPDKEQIGRMGDLQTLKHRDKAVKWAFSVFSIILICTFLIYVMIGLGFISLPEPLLIGLFTATVGQIAGLLMVIFKFIFKD
jgi:hypothetical protein